MKKNNNYRIEFHVHTIASNDSILTKYFILLMCKLKKIDCLAITDHNEIKYAKKYKDFFKKKHIEIIVGEEIFTKDGEIIGLYLNKKIEPGMSAEDTIKEIKKQNGYVYIPHPYDTKRQATVINTDVLEKISSEVDFIEIHNGRNVDLDFSKKQNNIAEKFKIRKVIGSDAHIFYELGRNYCTISSLKKEDLKNEIEKQEFKTNKCINFAHHNTKIVKIIKLVKRGDFDELCRIINKKLKRSR